jgi:hypothetical protein
MIGAAFDHPDEHQETPTSISTPECIKTKNKLVSPKKNNSTDFTVKVSVKFTCDSISSMNDTLNFSVHDIYYNLSK